MTRRRLNSESIFWKVKLKNSKTSSLPTEAACFTVIYSQNKSEIKDVSVISYPSLKEITVSSMDKRNS